MSRLSKLTLAAILGLLLAACAHKPAAPETPAIGPYPELSGRLLVIEPTRRWQVSIDWHAETPERGSLRLTHAASGTVIELKWQQPGMWLRDSRHPEFRPVSLDELRAQGIILPPWTLAGILLNRMPADFAPTRPGEWQTHIDGALIRLQWQPESKRLTLTDMTHGRRALLIINP